MRIPFGSNLFLWFNVILVHVSDWLKETAIVRKYFITLVIKAYKYNSVFFSWRSSPCELHTNVINQAINNFPLCW